MVWRVKMVMESEDGWLWRVKMVMESEDGYGELRWYGE
jgi:hypothetical protein